MRKTTTAALLLAAAISISAGPAGAAPADTAGGAIDYTATGTESGAVIRTFAGQLFITAPVAIASAIQDFTTINQPFTPAK